jgi:hypothetical protein
MASRAVYAKRKGRSSSQLCRPVTRVRIYARDSWACVWCQSRPKRLTLDHYVPRSKGGSNKAHNLVTSCPRCNFRRQNKPALVWASELAGLLETTAEIMDRVESALARVLPKYLP